MKRLLITAIATILLAGCLEFGDDVTLVAPNVTAKELAEVTGLTGLVFPEGTVGLGYFFLGSGIDDALALKVSIPEEKKFDFMKNDLFQTGDKSKPSIQIGKGQPWWELKDLKEREDLTKSLPQGKYVECSLGKEEGRWVAYISWMST